MVKLCPYLLSILMLQAFAYAEADQSTLVSVGSIDYGVMTVAERAGHTYLISQDGRFVFDVASVLDIWTNQTVRDATAIARASKRIPLKNLNMNPSELNVIETGIGPTRVDIFIDPQCKFCALVKKQSRMLEQQYTFHWYLLPIFEESKATVRMASCRVNDPNLVAAFRKDELESYLQQLEEQACDSDRYDTTLILGDLIGVTGIPFIVAENGETHRGAPLDLKGWLAGNRIEQEY